MSYLVISTIESDSDKRLGLIKLSRQSRHNALNRDMVESLYVQLKAWLEDDSIAAVQIESESEQVFCAGGDVVDVVHTVSASRRYGVDEAIKFFETEYRLDYLIHTYEKPLVVLADGLIMGGGVGLMVGASHRVVTEHSTLAMPESQIGFFPDVGGTFFLRSIHTGVAKLMAMTGCSINAADIMDNQFADFLVPHEMLQELKQSISRLPLSGDVNADSGLISDLINQFHDSEPALGSELAPYREQLNRLAATSDIEECVDTIASWQANTVFMEKAQQQLISASPVSLHLIHTQLATPDELTLAECFQYELGLVYRCLELHDFSEGVRAKLIDKDHNPDWLYKSVDSVSPDCLALLFSCVWPRSLNPLADLGNT